jgi:hypothetical protein
MIWYCLIRIDCIAFLSVYEHFREGNIGSPIYRIPLSHCRGTAQWVNKELEEFLKLPPSDMPSIDTLTTVE